jgi:hypothetical protein
LEAAMCKRMPAEPDLVRMTDDEARETLATLEKVAAEHRRRHLQTDTVTMLDGSFDFLIKRYRIRVNEGKFPS